MLPIGILDFAWKLGFKTLYPWQCRILLRYEQGEPVAAACANYTGKTSVCFVISALWTLYSFPASRVQYLSATAVQVENQFFAALNKFSDHPLFAGWQWLHNEIRTGRGGFCFGRSTDTGGRIEGLHDQPNSPAALLVDECKSISEEVMDALSRCHCTFKCYMSSTGMASGRFHMMMTVEADQWRTFWVRTSDCGHVSAEEIEDDRLQLKDSVFAVKHDARFLYDAGESMIALSAVRRLLADPPAAIPGSVTAFCDFAAGNDECVLALCRGNVLEIVDAWKHKDTMHSVGKFISLFRKLGLSSWQIGGDEGGMGHVLMDRLSEEGFHLTRVNNGSAAKRSDIFVNLAAEQWSEFGQAIEQRKVVLPPGDEKLVAQLTSRRKEYDSRGREKLESKGDLASRGISSPDRGDAIIGAYMMSRPGVGAITAEAMSWIRMGGPNGVGLFPNDFGVGEEFPSLAWVPDVSQLPRYPFNR